MTRTRPRPPRPPLDDHDAYDYWAIEEWGPTISNEEKRFRVMVGVRLAEFWDELRRMAPPTPTRGGITVNDGCGALAAAFARAMLLPEAVALTAMEDVASWPAALREINLRREWGDQMQRPERVA